jgi:hypothetical protein
VRANLNGQRLFHSIASGGRERSRSHYVSPCGGGNHARFDVGQHQWSIREQRDDAQRAGPVVDAKAKAIPQGLVDPFRCQRDALSRTGVRMVPMDRPVFLHAEQSQIVSQSRNWCR